MISFTSTYDESSLKFDSKSAASIFYPMSLEATEILAWVMDLAVADTVEC